MDDLCCTNGLVSFRLPLPREEKLLFTLFVATTVFTIKRDRNAHHKEQRAIDADTSFAMP
jgi:hypothetical protein